MQLLELPLEQVIPYPRNPRRNEGAVEAVMASIREFGFVNPIIVDAERVIIAGHTRREAALRLGLASVPVNVVTHLSAAQVKALRLADNRTAENAEWDNELLSFELGDLRDLGFDLALTGFSADELSIRLDIDALDEEGQTEDDAVPAVGKEPASVLGDIWLLGEHRVMCGDSTSIASVEALCGGEPVDACWTDPPYNVAYESKAGKIQNDDMEDGAFRQFLRDAFVSAFAVLREGGPIYVAHADTEGFNFRGAFLEAGFKLSGCLVWVKPSLVLGRSDYQWRHEPILYGWKPGAAHRWFGGRKKTTVIDAADMPFRVAEDGAVHIDLGETTLRISGEALHVEELVGSVIRAEKPKVSKEHPTMKPVGLVLGMLKNSSQRGDAVLDLFGGSGSTLIACQKSGRRARLMEFDPRYCDVIVRRWQEFSGRHAVLEGDGRTFAEVQAGRAGRAA